MPPVNREEIQATPVSSGGDDRYYWLALRRTMRRDLGFALLFSVAVHAGLFLYRGSNAAPVKPPVDPYVPTLDLIEMPKLEPEKPDANDTSADRNETLDKLDLAPPTQSDFPQLVPIDAFVQPIQVPVPQGAKLLAPARITRGDWGQGNGTKIFDLAALDEAPMPTLQIAPIYPEFLRRNDVEGKAYIEFVVDTFGKVQFAHGLMATKPDFELAALNAINNWRFRPGKKAGHAVYTRMREMFEFKLNQ